MLVDVHPQRLDTINFTNMPLFGEMPNFEDGPEYLRVLVLRGNALTGAVPVPYSQSLEVRCASINPTNQLINQ